MDEQVNGQEQYLKESSVGGVIKRGVKKMVTEMSSIKFLLLVFVCLGMWQKFIDVSLGLGTALILVGLREVPVEQILARFTGSLK